MKTSIYIWFTAVLFLSSCGNGNKTETSNDTKKETVADTSLSEDTDTEDQNDLSSLLNDAMKDGWELDNESLNVLTDLTKLAQFGELQIDQEELKSFLEKNGKTLEEFQSQLEKTKELTKKSGDATSLNDLEDLLGAVQKSDLGNFMKALESTGVSVSKEDIGTLVKQSNASGKRLSTNDKERNAKTVLKKIYPNATPNLMEEELMRPRTGMRYERLEMLEKLGNSNTKEEAEHIMTSFLNVSTEELSLLQKLPPEKQPIWSEKDAIEMEKTTIPNEVEVYLNSGNASPKFMDLVEYSTSRRTKAIQRFIRESQKARKKFFKKNPSWFTEGSTQGNTYRDQRNKYIFLPLGALSFADKVIAHDIGDSGDHSSGSIGAPNMDRSRFTGGDPRVCNLGIRGVLTLEFTDNAITDVNGPDLYVFELGAVEPTNLEISKNGKEWVNVGKIEGGTALIDIAEFVEKNETFRYIRLTDLESDSAVPGADVDAVAAIGGAVRLNIDSSVLFDTGKHNLKESAATELATLVAALEKFEKGMIVVEGHTDNTGSTSSNQQLSLKRAEEVSKFLQSKLSSSYKFQQKGRGESQPVAPNDSEENKQKNRRVEILVLPLK